MRHPLVFSLNPVMMFFLPLVEHILRLRETEVESQFTQSRYFPFSDYLFAKLVLLKPA